MAPGNKAICPIRKCAVRFRYVSLRLSRSCGVPLVDRGTSDYQSTSTDRQSLCERKRCRAARDE